MVIESKIARYGNSLMVRLPIGIARDLDLRDGDRITLRNVDGGVMIERSKHSRLAARLATVSERESELGAGRAIGTELLEG